MRQQERSGLTPESTRSSQQQYSRVASFNSQFGTTQKSPQRLHQFFERRCDIAPKALALVCDTTSFSYLELDELANRLANYLAARRGLGIGKRIGILLDRSVHTYVALLAVLKCGAAFVPLDPSFPSDRINFIAADATLDLLLITSKFKDTTANLCCPVLELDTDTAEIDQQPATRVKLALLREDDLCYIIYNSGSTGRPKGVAVNHSSICNFITVCTPIYGVTASDHVYQGMIVAFDFSIEEI
jgi:non-ribosomal peptide synthetase component F